MRTGVDSYNLFLMASMSSWSSHCLGTSQWSILIVRGQIRNWFMTLRHLQAPMNWLRNLQPLWANSKCEILPVFNVTGKKPWRDIATKRDLIWASPRPHGVSISLSAWQKIKVSRIEELFEPACPALDVPRLKRKWCCLGLSNCPIYPLMSHFLGLNPPVISCFISHLWLGSRHSRLSQRWGVYFPLFSKSLQRNHFHAHALRAMSTTTCADNPECGPRRENRMIESGALVVVELWKPTGRYSSRGEENSLFAWGQEPKVVRFGLNGLNDSFFAS